MQADDELRSGAEGKKCFQFSVESSTESALFLYSTMPISQEIELGKFLSTL